jgi:RNA polymerase-binding transcription factor DksA
MNINTLTRLIEIKEELNLIVDSKSESLLESTEQEDLQSEIERNVIDYMKETIEQIEIIIEGIEKGDYEDSNINDNY